jgi:multidrug efflux pump subunit AcrA (membrane-fusion protein)
MSFTTTVDRKLRIGGPVTSDAARDIFDDSAVWLTLAGAQQGGEFCRAWLSIQCRSITGTTAGLLLLEEGGMYKTAAVWPDPSVDATYLAKAAEQALRERKGVVIEAANDETAGNKQVHIAYPIDVAGEMHGVVVLDVTSRPSTELAGVMRQLHWGMGWLETLFRRKQTDEITALATRTTVTLDMLAGASEHRNLEGAALAVVNDLATRLACRRVSLGLVRNNAVRLVAISHSAVFQKKSHVVSAIENAMEEALDQNATLLIPESGGAGHHITLAHNDLAKLSGAQSVLSAIMSSAGRVVGVVTLERDQGDVFDQRSVALVEAVAVLLGPIFELKAEAKRLVTGRAADAVASSWTAVFGPGRPAIKLAVVAAVVVFALLAILPGDLRVSAKAVVEGAIQRAAVAPFDGYVASAPVRAGAIVNEGQLLATLDDRDLKLEAIRWRSEFEQQQLKYADAFGKHDRSAMRVAEAMMDEAKAQQMLAEDKLSRATLVAPFHAIIVSGDLSQAIGSPVEKGKVLFELAPLDSFRVVLQVDERDISLVKVGQDGRLLLTGLAHQSFPVHVTSVTPVATSADNRNTFRVEASVDDPDNALRPGMEGVGKITVGEGRLLYVWSRSLIDWVRVGLWKWWP